MRIYEFMLALMRSCGGKLFKAKSKLQMSKISKKNNGNQTFLVICNLPLCPRYLQDFINKIPFYGFEGVVLTK